MNGPSKTSWLVSLVIHGGLLAMLIFGPSLRPTVRPAMPSGPVMEAEVLYTDDLDLPPLQEPSGPDKAELERQEKERQLQRERLAEEARVRREREQEAEEARRAREKADQEAREKAEREATEKAEREAKEKAEREAKEKTEREATEKAEREAKEKAEQEAKEKAEREAKEKAEREAKEKAEREAKERAEREAKEKAEREAKEKAEREAKEKAEREAKAKAAREAELQRMLGLEEQRDKAVDNGLMTQYIAQIVAAVERNWNRPPSATEDLSCTVRATQIPGGVVVAVEIEQCNGSAAVQRSIENAVNKSSPLPEPADPTLFERNLVFIFEPN